MRRRARCVALRDECVARCSLGARGCGRAAPLRPPPAAAPHVPPRRRGAEHAAPTATAAARAAGRFGTVSVYVPQGSRASVAIFLSGDGGWELGVINMARALRDVGRGGDRRRHAPLPREPRLARRRRQRALPDDRGGLRALSHQVQKADRHERVPRAGARRLLLGRHGRVRDAGAVARPAPSPAR